MTNPNNGATLEDCHTNFFALTDLCGIKWRRLVSDGIVGSGHTFGPLDDPCLSSFARCLASDVLCVWRRSPNAKPPPITPHDPFQTSNAPSSQTPPHFMHQPPGPGGGNSVNSSNSQTLPPHLMPPHMNHSHMSLNPLNPHLTNFPNTPQQNTSQNSLQSPIQSPIFNNSPSLNGPKELWIFWYGEEPDLSALVSPQLLKSEADQGSWESGLTYECRTLLFKALHNLIERCLLSRDFVRIGKWFMQPCDESQSKGAKIFPTQLSFSFTFFVHGESTVCMSVDIRQHPSIKRITKNHLSACHTPNHTLPVILAPHGLAGSLTGIGYRINEPATNKILDEWKHFYPVMAALKSPLYETQLPNSTGPGSSPHTALATTTTTTSTTQQNLQQQQQQVVGIPPVLEVIVGGVRMRYPSCYVLYTEMDDNFNLPHHGSAQQQRGFNMESIKNKNQQQIQINNQNNSLDSILSECAAFPSGPSPGKPQGSHMPPQMVEKVEGLLPERVWQESILCSTQGPTKAGTTTNTSSSINTNEQSNSGNGNGPGTPSGISAGSSDSVGTWDFTDPSKKSICTCSKMKRVSGPRMSHGVGSHSTKGSSKQRRSTFHKRNPLQLGKLVNSWSNMWDLAEDSSAINANSFNQTNNCKQGSENQVPNSSTGNRTSGSGSGGGTSKGVECIGPSPAAASVAAQSPLATPRSQQPTSVPPMQQEPPMPTLSPNQPTSDLPHVETDNNSAPPKSVSSLSNQVFSPLVCGFDGAKSESSGGDHLSSSANNVNANANGRPTSTDPQTLTGTIANSSSENGISEKSIFRRPNLPSKGYEEFLFEENSFQRSEIIYDYLPMEAWLNYPVKRMKLNSGKGKNTTKYIWGLGMKRLQENCIPNNLGGRGNKMERGGGRDPYEFDEEAPAINDNALKRKEGEKLKEEEKSPYPNETGNKTTTNLFTSEGLQPSYRDLDQIFDNSDTSSDETFQAPTPPGSNKPLGTDEGGGSTYISGNGSSNKRSGLGILRPEELSKMFPTPPSHEHNPIASPCGNPETPSMEGLESTSSIRNKAQDNYPGSPPDEPIEDWSFVFKPPPLYKILGSSKYAPLQTLPSQQLSPLMTLSTNGVYKTPRQFSPPPAPSNTNSSNNNNSSNSNNLHHQQQQQTTHHLTNPPICVPNQLHLRPGLSPISPATNSIRGSQSFELGSPSAGSPMYLKGPHGPHQMKQQPPNQNQNQNFSNYCDGGSFAGHHPAMFPSRGGIEGTEAHALVVNLSLSDSVINLFRDHNFDSCTMCVCNASAKVVGNIRGSEMGLYIPEQSSDDESVRCNCGFSASVNRRLAHRTGLFYEDEYEITTSLLSSLVLPPDEWYEKQKPSFLLLDPKYPNLSTLMADKDATSSLAVVDSVPPYILEILREQCLLFFDASSASRATGEVIIQRAERTYNLLDYLDGNRAALTALEHGRTVMLEASGRSGFPRISEEPLKGNVHYIHKWAYLWALPHSNHKIMQSTSSTFTHPSGPKSSQEVIKVMKLLLPILQDAVHTRPWDAVYNVSGPLTWRQFHRLAGRGTDDRSEPQPIPSVLVGSEKDWVALSPLAIKFWEKLLLEPYGYPRDVAYIVVAPDNDLILQKVRTFFRELSTMYEVCQLGRHCPISKVLRDGILRVGRSAAVKLAGEPVDEWFTMLPDIPTSSVLRLYAQVCRHYLAPQLAQISLDQNLLETPNNFTSSSQINRSSQLDRPAPSPKMPPPLSGDSQSNNLQGPSTPKSENGIKMEGSTEYNKEANNQQDSLEEDERDPPALIIYLVEPFGFGSDNKDLHRMANLGLLRCYSSMLNILPENIRNNITLQVISLEDIMNLGNSALENRFKTDQLRALSLTIYSQCRRLITHQNNVKSLTGFGPAAASEYFLKTKDEKKKGAYKLYTPPYVLAPSKEKVTEGVEWLGGIQGQTLGGLVSSGTSTPINGSNISPPTASSVLYVAYCISEDQRWLLASATDDRGELLETTCISIYVPNRSKRKKASPRKHGLQKLMDFILGIMSNGVQPWRLVVGRLGRIGHGELESWSSLLSRKSLLRASNQLKDICRQCSLQYPTDTPIVLSACLVSLEPDSSLRLMPDQFTPDERFGGVGTTSNLSTPQDISCTHILVFPTSATTQSSQTAFQEQHINGPELGDDDLIFINVNDDITDGIDGMPDLQLGDIFSWADTAAVGSPRRDSTSQPGSPGGLGASGRQSPFQSGGQGRAGGRDGSDELGTVLQQPLALGYLVSTAPAGLLPPWFWASCPHRSNEKGNSVFLKSALHLHSNSVLHNPDDLLQQQSSVKQHALDSQFTTDVLRFVLEGYNALSWLCLDPKSHDRVSCLPVHIQKLLQLYYSIASLI